MVSYGIDRLRESMVKILDAESQRVAGSGFIIRSDGYLITCHHVIYQLASLFIEYQEKEYAAEYCQELSNRDKDIAILKIELENAIPVEIINPQKLESSIIVYGFPEAKEYNFPQGFDFTADKIRPSAPVDIRSTYSSLELCGLNPWNNLPSERAMFLAYRINARVDSGTSGGAVFAEELGGVVGVIQCSKSGESYVIRWDNILDKLERLELEPQKNAARRFLEEVEEDFKYLKLFHNPQEKIILQSQYIPIQVTLERRYKHEVESLRSYAESEAELKQIYAFKGRREEETKRDQVELKQIYAFKGRTEEETEETKREDVDWKEAKKEHQKIMVLADPGMGKSTLLRMEALVTAQTEKEKLVANKAKVNEIILPVFLRLSELAKQAEKSDDLLNSIPLTLKQKYPLTFPKIEDLFRDKLAKGQCLLLLDALDEVPKNSRRDLREKLNIWVKNYPCKLICTSRIVGYNSGFVNDAKEVEIVPFSDRQTEAYIKNWFTNAAPYLDDDSVSAEGLITELANKPQIQGLSQNPLLLSLLCSLYQTKDLTLPARRSQIYEQSVNYLLGKWSHQRESLASYGEGRIEAKIRLLEPIAYHFSQEGKDIFSGGELADQIENYLEHSKETVWRNTDSDQLIGELCEEDGIIVKLFPEAEQYLFLHRTFQEYFTASYFKRAIEENPQQGLALAKKHFFQYDWHETLSLLAGLLKDPVPLLQAITQEKDDIFGTLLVLAGLCISECDQQTHPLINKIIKKIVQFWKSYSWHFYWWNLFSSPYRCTNPSYLKSILIALGKIGNPEAVSALIAAIVNSYGYVGERAAEVLGEIGSPEAVDALIDTLNHLEWEVRCSAAEALGKIGNPEAVPALINTLNNSESSVRYSAAEALRKIGNPEAVSALIEALNDSEITVVGEAVWALAEIGNPEAVSAIIATLNHSDIWLRREAAGELGWLRREAARALGKIGNPEAVDALIDALLNDSDYEVVKSAAWALGEIGNPEAVDALIDALLNDSDYEVVKSAAWALGKIGSPEAVSALLDALNDSEWKVRCSAAKALGKIGNSEAVSILISKFYSSSSSVREEVAEVLGEIGNPKAVSALLDAFNDSEWKVRCSAAEALGKIGNPKAVSALLDALNDSEWAVRCSAAEALAEKGKPEAVSTLISILDSPYLGVREEAADALGKIGNPKAVDALIVALNDSNSSFRRKAADVLGKIGNPDAVDALIAALNDSNASVRFQAVEALGEIGNPEAVPALIAALNHFDLDFIGRATKALGKIDDSEILKKLIRNWTINIYNPDIFLLARKLAVRYSGENLPFIPVYPYLVRFSYSPILASLTAILGGDFGTKLISLLVIILSPLILLIHYLLILLILLSLLILPILALLILPVLWIAWIALRVIRRLKSDRT